MHLNYHARVFNVTEKRLSHWCHWQSNASWKEKHFLQVLLVTRFTNRNYFITFWKDSINGVKRFVLPIFLYAIKVLNFAGIKFRDFFRFLIIFTKFCTRQKFQIHKIAKLDTYRIEILFFLVFDQNMILIPVCRISLLKTSFRLMCCNL